MGILPGQKSVHNNKVAVWQGSIILCPFRACSTLEHGLHTISLSVTVQHLFVSFHFMLNQTRTYSRSKQFESPAAVRGNQRSSEVHCSLRAPRT